MSADAIFAFIGKWCVASYAIVGLFAALRWRATRGTP